MQIFYLPFYPVSGAEVHILQKSLGKSICNLLTIVEKFVKTTREKLSFSSQNFLDKYESWISTGHSKQELLSSIGRHQNQLIPITIQPSLESPIAPARLSTAQLSPQLVQSASIIIFYFSLDLIFWCTQLFVCFFAFKSKFSFSIHPSLTTFIFLTSLC